MSIRPHPTRPSCLQGAAHPLVSSRSAPELRSALSTQAQRIAQPPRETPGPAVPATRVVRQLHPVVGSPGGSPQALHETKNEAKHAGGQGALVPGRPAPLVRSLGTFMLPAQTRFEQDSDGLTALEQSVHISEHQPHTATVSSGEVTPVDPGN